MLSTSVLRFIMNISTNQIRDSNKSFPKNIWQSIDNADVYEGKAGIDEITESIIHHLYLAIIPSHI